MSSDKPDPIHCEHSEMIPHDSTRSCRAIELLVCSGILHVIVSTNKRYMLWDQDIMVDER